MIIKLSELKQLIRKGIAELYEDYEVGADDSVDLENPTVLWNNTFGMDDQETTTKLANQRINLNVDHSEDGSKIENALKVLMGAPGVTEARKKTKKDSHGCESPFAINKYAKKKSKYKSGMSMKEALPPEFIKKAKEKKKDPKKKKKGPPAFIKNKKNEDKYPSKAGWQGERDDDDDKAKKRKKMRAQLKGKSNPMKGPVKNTKKPKVSEDRYPAKDGWQGETYKDKQRLKPGKRKKQKTTMDKIRKENF